MMMINSVAWRQQDEKEYSYRPGGVTAFFGWEGNRRSSVMYQNYPHARLMAQAGGRAARPRTLPSPRDGAGQYNIIIVLQVGTSAGSVSRERKRHISSTCRWSLSQRMNSLGTCHSLPSTTTATHKVITDDVPIQCPATCNTVICYICICTE